MALQRAINVNGVEYPAAYSRIVVIRADKADAYIFVNTYADEAARQREDMPVYQEEPVTALSNLTGNLYPMAYAHLLTLPGFEGAIAVPASDEPA